jgi:hypothetical protein
MTNLKSGDIVLFSGRGLISWLIRIATQSKQSHVGIIYVENDNILLFDSTSIVKPSGVKLRPFDEVVKEYDGNVYYRRLDKPLTQLQLALFRKYIKDNLGKKYEESKTELILAAIGRKFNIKVENPSGTVYCSELIRDLFKLWGFIEHMKALAPFDFSEDQKEYLEMINNSLGKEIKIK